MDRFAKIAKRLDSFRDEMIDFQVKLCSFPAIAPSSGGEGEARKAEFILDFLRKNAFEDVTLLKAPDLEAPSGFRPNMLAFI